MEIFPEIGPRKFFSVPPKIRRQVSAHGYRQYLLKWWNVCIVPASMISC